MTARSPTTWSGMRRKRKTISSWCRRWWNKVHSVFKRSGYRFALRKRVEQRSFKIGSPMCLLCDDEKAYQAYMNYLDAMERQGKAADPDKAMDAVLDQLEANERTRPKPNDPANDKTLSPFFCSPINK